MQRFLLYLTIILNICITTQKFGQITPSFVRFDPPSFVSVDENFTTSIIFKIDTVADEAVYLKFNKPNSLEIKSAQINTKLETRNLSLLKNKAANEITLKINADALALDENYPYQIFLECISTAPANIDKNSFVWNVDSPKKFLYKSSTGINDIARDETNIYKAQNTAGNSIKFTRSSNLDIRIKQDEWKAIYTEFWLKSGTLGSNLFSISKGDNQDTLLTFSKNKFGFISFPIRQNELDRNDIYLGNDNWNYIGILLRNSISGVVSEVYVNSQLSYSVRDENSFDLQSLNISFSNKTKNDVFEVDRLKIWEYENDLRLADKNKHFLSYEADSSRIIFQTSFDNAGEFTTNPQIDNFQISKENIEYIKSDAPLFSKAPSLTVNVGSSYNSFVWYVQEYSIAAEFEIEKSIAGGEYQAVYSTFAEDDPLKIYYFTDEIINEYEVAYYRVKQINLDGSEVYSAEVKIGNKNIQEFKLSQNYPNPFNPITSIYVEVIIPTEFEVKVYDLVGNTVANLYDGYLAEGLHTFEFDGSNLPSGIYFYEVISPKSQSVKKMILAK